MTLRFIHSVISSSVPIILAALGGTFTNLAGKLNIALEGMMLIGSFTTIYVVHRSGNLLLSVLISIAVCCIFALLLELSCKLKANVFLAGLAINLLASGLTSFLMPVLLGSKGTFVSQYVPTLRKINLPLVQNLPLLGELFSGYDIFVYLSFLLAFLCHLLIYKTPFGYQIRATGQDSKIARDLGIDVDRVRAVAFLLSGVFAALAGAALSLPMKAFVSGMTNNRGWIALVAVILGGKKIPVVVLSCLVFGLFGFLSDYLQLVSKIPSELLMTIPYISTVVTMILYAYLRKYKVR
ncbi:ABC transporter permease [Pseudothermotoga sp. U03pept]|uniref:ABC transporter permease n=1 Tax=Pseudothermotoga sp. U03pept TaxID=3447012 RepID=UPI003F06822B